MLAVVASAAGIAAFYAYENWEGEQAWQAFNARLLAQGQRLDSAVLDLPPVPDEENFAAAPVVRDWFAPATNTTSAVNAAPIIAITRPGHAELLGDWRYARPTDLTEWRDCFRRGSRPAGPAAITADADAPVPHVVFDDVPLLDAIQQLAREAKVSFQADPGLFDPTNGPPPNVSLRWETVTYRGALDTVLQNYGLALVRMEGTPVLRLTRTLPPSQEWPFEVCDIATMPLPASADERLSTVTVDNAPGMDAIKIVARQAALNYLIDPSLSSALSTNYLLRLTNVTLRAALKRILADNGVALMGDKTTSIYRIIPAPPAPKHAPATAVLPQFEPFAEQFRALYAACERPRSQIRLENRRATARPVIGALQDTPRLAAALAWHGSAHLALSNNAVALQDATALLRMLEGFNLEPNYVAESLRDTLSRHYLQLVWEGLASRRWTTPELLCLEQQLASLDFLAAGAHGLRVDQAIVNEWLETTPQARLASEMVFYAAPNRVPGQPQPFWLLLLEGGLRWGPRAWVRHLQIGYAQTYQDQFQCLNPRGQRVYPAEPSRASLGWNSSGSGCAKLAAWLQSRRMTHLDASRVAGQVQTGVNQARVACALERYRQAHGRFPDFLSELVPSFMERLPHDLTTGKALNYRTTSDDQFVIYSAGLDERDNAATGDDWVWRYPAK